MQQFKPKDIIAFAIIVGIGFLKFNGFNGQLDAVVALVVGYYFGHRDDGTDNGL